MAFLLSLFEATGQTIYDVYDLLISRGATHNANAMRHRQRRVRRFRGGESTGLWKRLVSSLGFGRSGDRCGAPTPHASPAAPERAPASRYRRFKARRAAAPMGGAAQWDQHSSALVQLTATATTSAPVNPFMRIVEDVEDVDHAMEDAQGAQQPAPSDSEEKIAALQSLLASLAAQVESLSGTTAAAPPPLDVSLLPPPPPSVAPQPSQRPAAQPMALSDPSTASASPTDCSTSSAVQLSPPRHAAPLPPSDVPLEPSDVPLPPSEVPCAPPPPPPHAYSRARGIVTSREPSSAEALSLAVVLKSSLGANGGLRHVSPQQQRRAATAPSSPATRTDFIAAALQKKFQGVHSPVRVMRRDSYESASENGSPNASSWDDSPQPGARSSSVLTPL